MEPDRRVGVLLAHALPDGSQVDYVLYDRQGRLKAALEANDEHTALAK